MDRSFGIGSNVRKIFLVKWAWTKYRYSSFFMRIELRPKQPVVAFLFFQAHFTAAIFEHRSYSDDNHCGNYLLQKLNRVAIRSLIWALYELIISSIYLKLTKYEVWQHDINKYKAMPGQEHLTDAIATLATKNISATWHLLKK